MNMFTITARRFLKGFLAGGIAQVALIVGPGLQFHNMADVQAIFTTLFFAFITGGLLAIEKMLNYGTPLKNITIDSLPDVPPSDPTATPSQ